MLMVVLTTTRRRKRYAFSVGGFKRVGTGGRGGFGRGRLFWSRARRELLAWPICRAGKVSSDPLGLPGVATPAEADK